MSHKERVMAAIRRQPVDYVPCSPSFNQLSATQRRGKSWNFPWGPSIYEQVDYGVNVLDTDPVVSVSAGSWELHPDVSSRVWFDESDQTLHKVYDTPAGELSATVDYDERWPHGYDIPFFTDFLPAHAIQQWLETEQDVECLSYILRPVQSDAVLDRLRFSFMERKRIADEFTLATRASVGMGLTGALQIFGPSELCMMMVEKPGIVHRFLEIEHEVNMRRIEIAVELGTDIIARNGFYETTDFYSPKMLEEFIFGRIQKEADAAHQAEKPVVYTVNTGIMPMLDYLRRLNVDCLISIDIAFKDHDLQEIVDSQEGTKSFWIGPSSSYQLQEPDPEITRQAVRDCFEAVGKSGLIITPCPSLHSIMPWKNGLAMIDEWKKLR